MDKLQIGTAVVNGSLGAVGSALVRRLIEQGIKTYAVVYPGAKYEEIIPPQAHVVLCDMRNIEQLPTLICEPIDAYFHLAWMGTIGPQRDDLFLQTENIRCAVSAVQTVAGMGCKVFVGCGSQAECGKIEGMVRQDSLCAPTNGYGIAKLCSGQMTRLECKKLGIRHVWARILSVYGPNDGPLSVVPTILGKLLRGEKPSLTKGEQLWDFLYSADAAEALLCMALSGHDGAIYPVGSGTARPLHEYFSIIRDAVDPSLPLGIGEIPYATGQVMHLQADIEPLKNDTGFVPKFSFDEGCRLTIDAYRKKLDL